MESVKVDKRKIVTAEKRAVLEKARKRSLEVRRMKKAEKRTLLELMKGVDDKLGELLERLECNQKL